MATLGLLHGLMTLHHWTLLVWHGNHQWHEASATTAQELKDWCTAKGLQVVVNHAGDDLKKSEAAARSWRYSQLNQTASAIGADVVTGHTASDRAETILIQLARGTDLKGLTALREQRALNAREPTGCKLRRPMLLFDRNETKQICSDLKLPVWIDPSNEQKTFARNQIRHDIIPILENLYPSCSKRIAAMAERLSTTEQSQQELVDLCLAGQLEQNKPLLEILREATPRTRTILIKNWLEQQGIHNINSSLIQQLSHRLATTKAPGCQHFPNGWRVHWQQSRLYAVKKKEASA